MTGHRNICKTHHLRSRHLLNHRRRRSSPPAHFAANSPRRSNGKVITVDVAFVARRGYAEKERVDKVPNMLDARHHEPSFCLAIWRVLSNRGHWRRELWTCSKPGSMVPQRFSAGAKRANDGNVQRIICLANDMSRKKASERLVWRKANFDSLTGLPNRNLLRDRLLLEVNKAERAGKQVALFVLDLDRFKQVNDALGHEQGDQLLVEVARRLAACVRVVDTVARQGGDEFVIVMGALENTASVDRVAGSILDAIATPFQLGSERVDISTSIGVALYPRDGSEINVLLRHADQAMYAAKRKGRNRFHYYTQALQRAVMLRRRLIDDMNGALSGRQFSLYVQPIVGLACGTVEGVEALPRWHHPRLGMVSPGAFIEVAEQTGLITELGRWVFEEALRQAPRLRNSCGPDIRVSINTSLLQYHDRAFNAQQWRCYLQRCDILEGTLSVEIPEELLNAEHSEQSDIAAKLAILRDTGIQVALDNFGAGCTALASFTKFGIDILKIDRNIVSNLAEGSADFKLCEAIIAMAHKLGMQVIAQGVETERQHLLLQAAGCDLAQGYWYAKPAPLDAFERWFRSRDQRC